MAAKAVGPLRTAPAAVMSGVLSEALVDPQTLARLVGTPFPASVTEIGKHFGRYPDAWIVVDLASELRWNLAILRYYRDEVGRFLERKLEIESALFVGDYTRASTILEEVERTLGSSIWALEIRFFIEEKVNALTGNRSMLRDVMKSSASDWVKLLSLLYSTRAESSMSPSNFDIEFWRRLGVEHTQAPSPVVSHLQFRANFYGIESFDDKMLALTLAYDYHYSIIDRFQSFVRVLQVLHASPVTGTKSVELGALVRRAASAFVDPRLQALGTLNGLGIAERVHPASSTVYSAFERYESGDYASAARLALVGLQSHAELFDLHEVYVAALTRTGEEVSQSISPQARVICEAMLNLRKRNPLARDAAEKLRKFAYELDGTLFGAQLFSFVASHTVMPESRISADRWRMLSARVMRPRHALAFSDGERAKAFLTQLFTTGASGNAIALYDAAYFSTATKIEDIVPPIPRDRALKHMALGALRAGNFTEAVDHSAELILSTTATSSVYAEARELYYRALAGKRDWDACSEIASDALLEGEKVFFPAQLPSLVDELAARPGLKTRGTVAWPLLRHKHHREFPGARDNHLLHAALDDFLSHHGYARPSQVKSAIGEHRLNMLIYVLKEVCVPEVLDWSTDFTSFEDLTNERVAILELLESLDPEGASGYEEERTRLTRRLVVEKSLYAFDRGKINVNTAGIRHLLGASFVKRIERYLEVARLGTSLQKLFPSVEFKGLQVFLVVQDDTGSLRRSDDGFLLFKGLFEEVRTRFLWSDEYGLDSALSVQIRHGTLSGQLREPFERAMLITRKDAKGSYSRNDFWLERAVDAGVDEPKLIDDAFNSFSSDIDEAIEEIKEGWIQIKDAKHNDALFDFEFSDDELREIRARVDKVSEPDAFVEAIFDSLWERSRQNLDRIRAELSTRLATNLISRLNKLESELVDAAPSLVPEFRPYQTACEVAINEELQHIATWFTIDQASAMSDYDLAVLLDTALERVRRTPGAREFLPLRELDNVVLKGHTFRPLCNIMFFVLENIVRHSPSTANAATVAIYRDGKRLRFSVRNLVADDVDLLELEMIAKGCESHARGEGTPGHVRSEGGSGYSKIGKLLRVDLSLSDACVSARLKRDIRQFEVIIEVGLQEVAL